MANAAAIEKTEKLLQELRVYDGSSSTQAALIHQLDEIRNSLQQPREIANYYIKKGLVLIIINTCVELGVFDAVLPDTPASAEDIADKVGVDASILTRFLRAPMVEGFFSLAAPDGNKPQNPPSSPYLYRHTPASLSLRGLPAHTWWRTALTLPMSRFWRTPDYIRSHSTAELQDSRHNALAWAMGLESEGLTFFEALDRDKQYAGFWWSAMGMAEYGFGSFPWAKLWEDVSRKQDGRDRVFVVDVGGGRGKRLVEIIRELGEVKDKEPSLKPMMVLEDLGGVIGGETPVSIEGVKNVVYDFFQQGAEQPVKGAHVYHLRHVLHDYYDEKARQILKQVVDAMRPDSRVILCEYIIPEEHDLGHEIFPYVMDFLLFLAGGLERTHRQWQQLLDSVGLEIMNIWPSKDGHPEVDIEACLKDTKPERSL
ncbi:S-adenosyl-L-methionine-dependent methyltransferase [Canariomyces notabilis]|uniref:S-adenosyl-L-methionine-dependent methyltransferase n=1 Tax=Canariomyces notabilis TaxID=2074819 RepID=A0AAN6QF94_9PEZI|nr:S-adenosyl-L-methionine-dependent methyltransferase [Canariomyces arenarius]